MGRESGDARSLLGAGGGFVLAGVLELLMSLGPGIAVTDTVTIPYDVLGFPLVPQLVLLVSAVLLARWLRRTGGVTSLGWIGLVVFGAGGVLGRLLALVGRGVPLPLGVSLGTALEVLPVVGVVVGALFIARGDGVRGPSRWALAPLAVVELVTLPLLLIPSAAVVPALLLLESFAAPLSLVGAGAAFVVDARSRRSAPAETPVPVRSR